jgi:hypothetical protein
MQADPRSRRIRGAVVPIAVAAVAALVVAGCGGSSSPTTTTTAASSGPQKSIRAIYRFAACMRAHGVPNFPDPKVTQGPGGGSVAQAAPSQAVGTPAFNHAQKACQGILPPPQSPAQQAQQDRAHGQVLLAFVRCLRSHGVPKFPDPNSQGQLSLQTVQAAGVDLHAPAVLTAAKACVGVTHGQITMAQVEQAISGQH